MKPTSDHCAGYNPRVRGSYPKHPSLGLNEASHKSIFLNPVSQTSTHTRASHTPRGIKVVLTPPHLAQRALADEAWPFRNAKTSQILAHATDLSLGQVIAPSKWHCPPERVVMEELTWALSPGSFSEESMLEIDRIGAAWLFIRSADEQSRSVRDLFPLLRQKSRTAEMLEVVGSEHATDILTAHPELAELIAVWFKYHLR